MITDMTLGNARALNDINGEVECVSDRIAFRGRHIEKPSIPVLDVPRCPFALEVRLRRSTFSSAFSYVSVSHGRGEINRRALAPVRKPPTGR